MGLPYVQPGLINTTVICIYLILNVACVNVFFPIVSEVQHGHMWQVCFHVMCPFVRAESGWMLHYSIDHGAITWGDLREMKSAEWCRLALTNCSNIVLG